MVMLELFHLSEISFGVAHCNFGLRGEESDGDEDFVARWTQERGIDCFINKIEIEGSSIQVEAREKRYQWFHELCKEKSFQKIATAHHLNDSLETTLLNLTRGTGIKGLAGIPVQNGAIIRPLLFPSREELLDFAQKRKLLWREDSSNLKADYDRNKVRLEVVTKLKEINPSLEQTFKNTKERFDMLADFVADKVEIVIGGHFDRKSGKLKLGWIQSQHDLIILSEILSQYGFNYVTSREIFEAIGHPGKTFEANDWKVVMDRDSLFIQRADEDDFEEVLIGGEGVFKVGSWKLEVRSEGLEAGSGKFEDGSLKMEDRRWERRDEAIAMLDRAKLAFPIKIRRWEQGDYIQPLGMKGKKKVSDLLIDLKVPLAKKDKVLVLESSGEIAWVIGYRISEKFKVEDSTKNVMFISVVSNH